MAVTVRLGVDGDRLRIEYRGVSVIDLISCLRSTGGAEVLACRWMSALGIEGPLLYSNRSMVRRLTLTQSASIVLLSQVNLSYVRILPVQSYVGVLLPSVASFLLASFRIISLL